ncbi:MAG: hypothetical protein JNJ65_14850 [Cyclobacteriaceae bacterium]|nr:hypothetical protein [Cyclobacteriaceae bacterium]
MEKTASAENVRIDQIEWKQLWSLAALYGSIVIGWITYHNYQPKLLVQFNFTQYSFLLVIVQGIILIATPPVAGKFGDRFRFRQGHRLPIISSGISFAAMVFMAVAFTLMSSPGETLRWILPFLIVLWLVAMSIFTSPALSTLELFTPIDQLPRAMAILTIVANLVYSLEPVIVDLIDYLGAPITFIIGGLAVFVSGYALRKNSMNLFNSGSQQKTDFKLDTQRSNYGYIFLLGTGLGISTTLLFNYFPSILESNLADILPWEGKWLLVLVLFSTAVLSLPASSWISTLGVSNSFGWSLAINLLSIAIIFFTGSGIVTVLAIIMFTLSFTVLSISSLPLAIERANYFEKVFCVGIFFSGVALPDGIVESLQALGY